ncbi:MAG: hypothetical protein EpisKO_10910 [Epibacterium sp.]
MGRILAVVFFGQNVGLQCGGRKQLYRDCKVCFVATDVKRGGGAPACLWTGPKGARPTQLGPAPRRRGAGPKAAKGA